LTQLKMNKLILILLCLALSQESIGQAAPTPASFNRGLYTAKTSTALMPQTLFMGKHYQLIQFQTLPSQSIHKQLTKLRIELLNFIPPNSYIASIPEQANVSIFSSLVSVDSIPSIYKISTDLDDEQIALLSVDADGFYSVTLSYYQNITREAIENELFQLGINYDKTSLIGSRINIHIPKPEMTKLAYLPWVSWLEPTHAEATPNDKATRTNARVNYIANTGNTMRGLTGDSVVIGIGDGGFVAPHKDFENRINNMSLSVISGFGDHGDHVNGIAEGSGKLFNEYRGMAPKATVFTNQASNILDYTPILFSKFGMTVTNNSYSFGWQGCFSGKYTGSSAALDAQLLQYPLVNHCFAAANDGSRTCSPYPASYNTVHSDFNVSKNVITVGNVTETDAINSTSSRGPAFDGRIKPDICSVGNTVLSTIPTHTYGTKTGTSMASPGVTGSIALLTQRYRQLNSNQLPNATLLKALLCNTADDIGTSGPDFTFGYGRLNLRRAVLAMENVSFNYDTAYTGDSNIHFISIPNNAAELRVMLSWRDRDGAANAFPSLVNNLDLQVIDPSNNIYKPWVLDTTKANVANAATRKQDVLNNAEQVTISNPPQGSYTIKVNGTSIPYVYQDYYIVYEIRSQEVVLTSPVGGEKLLPTVSELIRWDASGLTSGTWTLDYSDNNGSSWTNIVTGLSITATSYNWTTPNVASTDMLVRIIHSGGQAGDTSINTFTIMGRPAAVSSSVCDGSVNLTWGSVSNADSFYIYMLDSVGEWNLAGVTSKTRYTVSKLTNGTIYFFAISAKKNSAIVSEKTLAIQATPSATACTTGNDAGVLRIFTSTTGRKFTSNSFTTSDTLKVYIKNYGSNSISNVPIYYSINNGSPVSETYSATITSNSSAIHTFNTTTNFSAAGTYLLKVWTALGSDTAQLNDTFITQIRQLNNAAVTLPYSENFGGLNGELYTSNYMGILGATAFDYSTSSTLGRCRTNIKAGFSADNMGITLDKSTNSNVTVANKLTLTLNLSNYTTSNIIQLNILYTHHGEEPHNGDSIWVRGSDTSNWIKVLKLTDNLPSVGASKAIQGIRIDSILAANNQNFSSSFQLSLGQEDDSSARYYELQDGFTFDEIQIIDGSSDIQVSSLPAPVSACGMGSSESVTVRVINKTSTTLTNIPVYYQINGGAPVSETIGSLSANATLNYTFATTANLSSAGNYTFKAWTGLAADQNKYNDTSSLYIITSSALVSTFPYYESFESDDGNWLSSGSNSSWQWGVPAKPIFDSAANGSKCWATSLSNYYNTSELSYLNSPCFDFSSLGSDPILSFNYIYDLENSYDYAWVEYSENGTTWSKLGSMGSGTRWYNNAGNAWTGIDTPWAVSSYTIPVSGMSVKNQVRLRFVMYSDGGTEQSGLALDDISIITTNPTIYAGNTSLNATSTGAGWVDFMSGGQRILSVNDGGNNLGNITVNDFKHFGAVRSYNGQPYLNRNWVITPTNQPTTGNCTIRLYILKTELDSLIAVDASAASFQHLGITKYSNINEDSNVANNYMNNAVYTFITPSQVKFLPFNNGYFVEFEVSSFSEFYVNAGGAQHISPLPISLLNFTALASKADALIQWWVADEQNITRYELERRKPNEQKWETIYTCLPKNKSNTAQYEYTDLGVLLDDRDLYYRLKSIEKSGQEYYSNICVLANNNSKPLSVSPNPFKENIIISNPKKLIGVAELYNSEGKLVISQSLAGSSSTMPIGSHYTSGIYILKIIVDNNLYIFKVVKQ
jgi:hypothetical protein